MKNKKVCGIRAAMLAGMALLFGGCDMFNQSLPKHLEFWTDIAQIRRHAFDSSYPELSDYTQIPSGKDQTITYTMINPQGYLLDAEVTFPESLSEVPEPGVDYTIEQGGDKTLFYLTLADSFLAPLDGYGTEITPVVRITEPESRRDFGSYSVPLLVNSPPAAVEKAIVLSSGDASGTYVIAFNLPDMSGVHRDITELTVSAPFNRTYTVLPETAALSGSDAAQAVTTVYNENWKPVSAGGAENAVFIGDKTTRFIGIVTDVPLSDNTTEFDITLHDAFGLSTTVSASSRAPKLDPVTANVPSGSVCETGAVITFSSPVSGATVIVSCSPAAGVTADPAWQASDEVALTFTEQGTYTVTARAQMSGAADSDTTVFTYTVKGPTPSITIPGVGEVTLTTSASDDGVIEIEGIPNGAAVGPVLLHGKPLEKQGGSDTAYMLPDGIDKGIYELLVTFTYGGISYDCTVSVEVDD